MAKFSLSEALKFGAIPGFFGGKSSSLKKIPNMSPEQQQLLNQLLGMLGPEGGLGQAYGQALGGAQELLDPSSAAQQRFAQPYLQQFEQQTIPGLAERFAGAGGGALSSSGFGQALSSAGGNLQSQLAQLKSQLQQGAMKDIFGQYQGMLGQGLGASPFSYLQKPGQQGLGESVLSQLLPALLGMA